MNRLTHDSYEVTFVKGNIHILPLAGHMVSL